MAKRMHFLEKWLRRVPLLAVVAILFGVFAIGAAALFTNPIVVVISFVVLMALVTLGFHLHKPLKDGEWIAGFLTSVVAVVFLVFLGMTFGAFGYTGWGGIALTTFLTLVAVDAFMLAILKHGLNMHIG